LVPTGTNGTNGLNGSAVVTRASGGPATSVGSGTPVVVPLANAAWTQQPGETDVIWGTENATYPATCSGGGSMSGIVLIDGKPGAFPNSFGDLTILGGAGSPTVTTTLIWLDSGAFPVNEVMVPEVASATTHTLSASIKDSCTGAGERFTENSLQLWVAKYV
jgi:hypothetical protein